jgi:hypothetical protein
MREARLVTSASRGMCDPLKHFLLPPPPPAASIPSRILSLYATITITSCLLSLRHCVIHLNLSPPPCSPSASLGSAHAGAPGGFGHGADAGALDDDGLDDDELATYLDVVALCDTPGAALTLRTGSREGGTTW